jgi:hypothetical protein
MAWTVVLRQVNNGAFPEGRLRFICSFRWRVAGGVGGKVASFEEVSAGSATSSLTALKAGSNLANLD